MPVYKSFPSSPLAKRFKLIEGEILFAISKAKKRRNVPLGTIASVEEVCELFDHPIFNNINLGNEQELYPNEQVKFNQKLLEVPIDSIIDQFQSMVPFFTTDEISINKISTPGNMGVNDFDIGTPEALNPQTDNETRKHMYYGLGLNSKWPGHPENPYIGGSCLPRIVHENLSIPAYGAIDWQAKNKYNPIQESDSGDFDHPSHVTISPDNSCVMCIFFIKELHAALKVRFDEILKSEAILKDQLIKQATDLGIQLNPHNQIPNDQSFFLQEPIEIELRRRELAEFVKQNGGADKQFSPEDYISPKALEQKKLEVIKLAEEERRAAEVEAEAEEKRRVAEAEAQEKRRVARAEEKRIKDINTIFLYIDLLVILILILPLIYMHRTLKLGVEDRFSSIDRFGIWCGRIVRVLCVEPLKVLLISSLAIYMGIWKGTYGFIRKSFLKIKLFFLRFFSALFSGFTSDEEEDDPQAIQAIKESAKTETTATYGSVPSNLATAICRMAYCIAAVDGQITDNEWEAIKEGLSFVNLSPDTFNDAVEDLDSFDMDQLNSELHSLSAFLRDNSDHQTKDTVHEFLMDIASSDHYFEGAKQDWITITHDEYWFPED